MLNPAQKKRLSDLEQESVMIGFERTRYTFDYTLHGIAEWDRLLARSGEIQKEIERLKGVDHVSTTVESIPAQA